MAEYLVPAASVFQNYVQTPTVNSRSLRAATFGPHAFLVRFLKADEQDLGRLGAYDPVEDTSYLWPNRPVGGLVDQAFTRLHVKNAKFEYFHDDIGSGSTITKVSGYSNRIRSNSVSFAENGDYARSASLLSDVRKGDAVYVRGVVSGTSYELNTTVRDIVGDVVAGVVGTAAIDASNAATATASASGTQDAGPTNCVSGPGEWLLDADDYDGLETGDVTETYTVRVIQSSVGGDLTTARLRVTSASGRDDVASVAPAALDAATDIGTRGFKVTISKPSVTTTCESDALSQSISDEDLLVGMVWTFEVTQAFTRPTGTAAGTYTGASTTYIVTVTRGGNATATDEADRPQVIVTTTRGDDKSPLRTLSAAALATSISAFTIGTRGVTLALSQVKLRKGDIYYVPVTGTSVGNMRTLVLADNLPSQITSEDLEVKLFMNFASIEIPKNRMHAAPLVNFSGTDTEVTINSGIEMTFDRWTDEVGNTPALPLTSGDLFITYRAWLPDLANSMTRISTFGELNSLVSGPADPDNPLKYMLSKMLANTGGNSSIGFIAVTDPNSLTAWANVLEVLQRNRNNYGLVPITEDQAVVNLFISHANSFSGGDVAQYCRVWRVAQDTAQAVVVSTATSLDNDVVLATISDDPLTSGTQYTRVQVPAGNSVFITNNVQPGDVLRIGYTDDGFGAETWSEYVIDSVESENELRLVAGPAAAITTAMKIEIWHTLDNNERAVAIAANSGAFGSHRVSSVWPDRVKADDQMVSGVYLAGALAALRSAVEPHQPLTRVLLSGFQSTDRSQNEFTRAQLNTMARGGTHIVEQNLVSGGIYSRHALTTADYTNLGLREESIVSNVDSISYQMFDFFDPFVGRNNLNPLFIANLQSAFDTWMTNELRQTRTVSAGPQLLDGTSVVEFRQSTINADQLIVNVDAVVPAPGNGIRVGLNIYTGAAPEAAVPIESQF